MARIIKFDDEGNVIKYMNSAHTPDFIDCPNCIVNPNVEILKTVPLKHLKVANGKLVKKSRRAIEAESNTEDAETSRKKLKVAALLKTIQNDPELLQQLKDILN